MKNIEFNISGVAPAGLRHDLASADSEWLDATVVGAVSGPDLMPPDYDGFAECEPAPEPRQFRGVKAGIMRMIGDPDAGVALADGMGNTRGDVAGSAMAEDWDGHIGLRGVEQHGPENPDCCQRCLRSDTRENDRPFAMPDSPDSESNANLTHRVARPTPQSCDPGTDADFHVDVPAWTLHIGPIPFETSVENCIHELQGFRRCGPDVTDLIMGRMRWAAMMARAHVNKVIRQGLEHPYDYWGMRSIPDPASWLKDFAKPGGPLDVNSGHPFAIPGQCPIDCPNSVTLCEDVCISDRMLDDLAYGFTAAEILQYFWQAASAAHLAALLKEGQPDSAAAECAWGIGWDANKDDHWLRDTAAFCALLKPKAECLQTHECAPCPHEWKLA